MDAIVGIGSRADERPRPGRSDRQQFVDGAFHRWNSSILGFSDRAVTHLISRLSINPDSLVLDPFCGSGTTLIECAKAGIHSIGVDANPFAVFAAKVKSDFDLDPVALRKARRRVVDRFLRLEASGCQASDDPAYGYLQQSGMLRRNWISEAPLRKALLLKRAIGLEPDPRIANALMLALMSDLPTNIGNMKYGPQIYRGAIKVDVDILVNFNARVQAMCYDLKHAGSWSKNHKPMIFLGDARALKPAIGKMNRGIDAVICSPPYPTEHDYTRHTRLELAFTENVSSIETLRRIKKSMIRSHTKGIYVDDSDGQKARGLPSVEHLADRVAEAIVGKTSGFEKLYPTVVRAYFGGMKRHFASLYRLMNPGAKAAYIVGDQAAYIRVPIRTAVLLGETARSVGFQVEGIERWRNRWATGMNGYLEENILLLTKRR